jgi:soluble lytic murein transglycosylase-like protein
MDMAAARRRIAELTAEAPSSEAPRAVSERFSFQSLIERYGAETGVDPALLEAVITGESAYDPRAVSPAGARGLMQLMPQTAAALGVSDPNDPQQNIRGGARYLRSLLDHFRGDVRLAVAAYNAGPGAVERYAGIPPYKETRAYVGQVMATYEMLHRHIR